MTGTVDTDSIMTGCGIMIPQLFYRKAMDALPAGRSRGESVDILKRMKRQMRRVQLKMMLGSGNLSAYRVERIVDTIMEWARSDQAAGDRKDLLLFSFEISFEEISDEIAQLADRGDTEAYRDIYEKLYGFACEMMEDTYMPLYLFILYRYANALFMTGDTGRALQYFEKLLDGTDRLIGIGNSYGIHCLERIATAAAADGQTQKALEALNRMERIAADEFGEESAMSMAVGRLSRKLCPAAAD